MADKTPPHSVKPKPQKTKAKKPFQIPKLSETQWSLVGGVAAFVVYGLYAFVFNVPQPVQQGNGGITAPIQKIETETAEAKFKRENKNISLPNGSAVPQNIIDENTKLTQQVPFGDNELEFRVRLPANWVISEFARYGLPGQENYTVLTNIARYFGPAIEDARPYMWVEAERIRHFMTAETWARSYMIKRGIAPAALDVKSPTEVQALYADVRDEQSYAVRALFRIQGDTMVLVSYGVPLAAYADYKDMMGLALNSFQLLHPINRQIEEIKQQKLLNVIEFDYYASWLPTNIFADSTLRPAMELHNPQEHYNPKGDLLQGLILVNAWRKSPQFPETSNMQEIKDKLQELSMILKDPIDKPQDMPLHGNFVSIKRTPYLAQVNTYIRKDQFDIIKSDQSKTDEEVWITVLDNGYYLTYLTLITPIQATNYLTWAQNMAAYDLLLQTLQVRGSTEE